MKRLDILIAEHQNISREKAKELIKKGFVSLKGKILLKSSILIENLDYVNISQPKTNYVSRGGYKLEHAISTFGIDISEKICVDIGSSTGGFTDCLLQHGATLVYAIDVGTEQLHSSLHNHSQIISLENTNIRTKPNIEQSDIIVIDVSFISLSLVLPIAFQMLNKNGICIALIKPQFEVGLKNLNKQGVVKDKKTIDKCLKNIENISLDIGFKIFGKTTSPITGKTGNIEYFLALRKE